MKEDAFDFSIKNHWILNLNMSCEYKNEKQNKNNNKIK